MHRLKKNLKKVCPLLKALKVKINGTVIDM